MTRDEKVRHYIKNLLLQEYEETRLDKSLTNINCILRLDSDTHVPDTLTRIRVLPTVSVVGQRSPVDRNQSGASVEVYVKFLPNSSETYKNIMSIGKLIKSLPGVNLVKVVSLGGRPITFKGKPVII
jgi:hypothetical protein